MHYTFSFQISFIQRRQALFELYFIRVRKSTPGGVNGRFCGEFEGIIHFSFIFFSLFSRRARLTSAPARSIRIQK